jgi:hypothetical protein
MLSTAIATGGLTSSEDGSANIGFVRASNIANVPQKAFTSYLRSLLLLSGRKQQSWAGIPPVFKQIGKARIFLREYFGAQR